MALMLRVNTTVVALVNASDGALDQLDAPNVAVHRSEADAAALERAQAAWSAAHGAGRPYFVHDADPLATIADAWVREFDGRRVAGELDVARAETLARWRAGSIALPDFYLVVAPDDLAPTERHWFLGVLAGAAAHRVVLVEPGRSTLDHLGSLPAGRWWPPLDRFLDGIENVVPDAGPASTGTDGPQLVTSA
jgi:hypothetical protein